jgi:HSP20 family protein
MITHRSGPDPLFSGPSSSPLSADPQGGRQTTVTIHGRADVSLPEGVAPLYLEYEPGDYERAFTLSDAVDPGGIEARVRDGVVHLRLPKAGPAKPQRIAVRAD